MCTVLRCVILKAKGEEEVDMGMPMWVFYFEGFQWHYVCNI